MADQEIGIDVLAIIAAGHAQSSATSDHLISSLMRECDEMKDAIQGALRELSNLLGGPHMPTPSAIWAAASPLLAYDTHHRYREAS
jgi:hypothetical protein